MDVRKKLCKEMELEELTKDISRILYKNFFQLFESFEELQSEVTVTLLESRQKLCSKEKLNLAFLVTSVRNRLIDKFFRSKKLEATEFSDLEDEEGNRLEVPYEDNISPIALLNVREAIEELKSELKESEIETLCYYLFSVMYRKEENPFLKEKSSDARYKAWSRLRPKVGEILKPFEFSEEEMKLMAELLLSEFLMEERFKE